MNKIFLYLYPIEDNFKHITSDSIYDKKSFLESLKLLNRCIQKRYRDSGYKVVIALYPDKKIYGVVPKQNDQIIQTDISFKERHTKYPSEILLLEQIGKIDKLVIGGFHYDDCVRRVGEKAFDNGIVTLVDLDLTDLFFELYQSSYFSKKSYNEPDIKRYNPQKYKDHWFEEESKDIRNEETLKKQFYFVYDSPIYGFKD